MSKKTEVWKKASEVYADISELSPQQALAYVYGIQNITLDVREAIITLINAGSQASQYYKDNISQGFNLGINNAQSFSVGQQLDEYELLQDIGHGGMSQVFKAKRVNTEQQTHVAIKIFAPKDSSNELLNHFLNEQKILAGLSHLNIVKMLHSGQTDDHITYLVMELIEDAQPLDSYCENNKLNTKQKIKYIAQCAQALSYSHANLIIHRDLKPDNILINQNQELKIVDFGIAKLINNDLSGNKTTIMALTPSYAAPEQINSEAISIKTDIFSLAVVALDLLSKENPLPKDRLIKSCANDEHHIDTLLKSLDCDKDLKNILRKALNQEPDKRYSSMQSFADDLSNYLQDKPVNATAQSFFYRIQKFAKRRSALFATLVSFLVFLIVGSFFGYQQYQQIKIEAEKANQVKQFMLDAFEITNPNNTKGTKISVDTLLKSATNKLKVNTKLDAQIKFELLQTLGIAYGHLGYYQQGIENLKLSLEHISNDAKSISYIAQYLLNSEEIQELGALFKEIDIEEMPADSSNKARLYRVKAGLLVKEPNFKESEEYLLKALSLNEKSNNSIDIILTKKQMAQLYFAQSKPDDSIAMIKTILAQVTLDKNHTLILSIQSDLALYYNKIGQFDLALREYENIISIQRSILGEQHPDLGESLIQVADIYRAKGDLKNSYIAANESYEIYKNLFGENNSRTGTALNMMGILSYLNNDMPKAIEQLKKVVDIFEKEHSPEHLDTLEAKANLAGLLNALKRTKEAEVLLREVYKVQLKKLGEDHLSTLFTQEHLASALSSLGKHVEAIKMAIEASEISKQKYGLSVPVTIGAFLVLGRNYENAKKYQKSFETYNYILTNKLLAKTNPKYPTLVLAIAEMSFKLDNPSIAHDKYIESIRVYSEIYPEKSPIILKSQLKFAVFLKHYNKTLEFNKIIELIESTITRNSVKNKEILDKLADLKN